MATLVVRVSIRALLSAALLASWVVAPGRAVAAVTPANWSSAQQHQVVETGLMRDLGRSFGGANRLSAAQANAAMVALGLRLQSAGYEPAAQAVSGAKSPVTVAGFDAMLVEQVGLGDVAAHVQAAAVGAGLRPPAYFGSETVARFLELRYEHPVGGEQLDLFPYDPITRAEAAWSLAQLLGFDAWNGSSTRQALSGFELPPMTAPERQALRVAVARIGYPYVWGGTTDDTSDGRAHGGYDCSGFAWRVFKLSGLPSGQQIQGRTAAEQAGEIRNSERLLRSQLEPGDLLFFGSAHFTSKATEKNIIHEGIYLGDNWVIHSSGQGVYVQPLEGGWLGTAFAWGRRVL
jgi:cell wall-associated NlpC family hydrolase